MGSLLLPLPPSLSRPPSSSQTQAQTQTQACLCRPFKPRAFNPCHHHHHHHHHRAPSGTQACQTPPPLPPLLRFLRSLRFHHVHHLLIHRFPHSSLHPSRSTPLLHFSLPSPPRVHPFLCCHIGRHI